MPYLNKQFFSSHQTSLKHGAWWLKAHNLRSKDSDRCTIKRLMQHIGQYGALSLIRGTRKISLSMALGNHINTINYELSKNKDLDALLTQHYSQSKITNYSGIK